MIRIGWSWSRSWIQYLFSANIIILWLTRSLWALRARLLAGFGQICVKFWELVNFHAFLPCPADFHLCPAPRIFTFALPRGFLPLPRPTGKKATFHIPGTYPWMLLDQLVGRIGRVARWPTRVARWSMGGAQGYQETHQGGQKHDRE